MASIPVVSPQVRSEERGGRVLLRYPVAVAPLFGSMAKRFGVWDGTPPVRKLELDEIGSAAWEWIDGKRDVRRLAELLADKYGLHRREAEVSMAEYLRQLGRRGIIAFK